MKENLFFRATRLKFKKGESNSIFSVLMVLALLSIPTFFNAKSLENDIPPQNEPGIIYVGEGARVYGMSNISNAVVVNIQSPTAPEEITSPNKKSNSISEQVTIHKISAEQKAKRIKEEVAARTTFYYFSEGNPDSISGSSSNVHSGEVATAVTSFKISGKAEFSPYVLHFFALRCEKQKFYTSLSFIQFRNFRSSALRAPPISLI